ncbi:MAG TPA: RDD family protein [Gammaproteobacteria bacterium]|nr:RDD family protein [Gammaproteobacteria bacterium]|tara:strand:+ start:163 stop:609 length:447 start_codon:yes stop_codon:yes gene_type:complete
MSDHFPNASLIRRFAAMLYDSFLIVALWMISTTLIVAFLTEGDEVNGAPYQIFLYVEVAAFYIYFWHFKGQTLGMQVWKIRAVTERDELLTIDECIIRFLCATLSVVSMGLGFLWIFFNQERLAWHDLASRTRVVYLGKNPYRSEEQP